MAFLYCAFNTFLIHTKVGVSDWVNYAEYIDNENEFQATKQLMQFFQTPHGSTRETILPHVDASLNQTNSTINEKKKSSYAYAYLVAGCHPSRPGYIGYICNIIVSAGILRLSGSTSDIVVMIRMAKETTHDKLPEEHEDMLRSAGVKIKYIPKVSADNFYTAQMDKFRILTMVEYRRVFYMDSDVIPLCNLDYFFELSDGPDAKLRENIVIAYNSEPAHGGLFMLTPNMEDFFEIKKIIANHLEDGSQFDSKIGWGHEIVGKDVWKALPGVQGGQLRSTKWDFYGAFADQGLLYYWTKYVKKNVSVMIGESAESWYNRSVVDDNDKVISMKINEDLHMVSTNSHTDKKCSPFPYGNFGIRDFEPYSDFFHFTGAAKPWREDPAPFISTIEKVRNTNELWYFMLRREVRRLNLPIETEKLKNKGRPRLGIYPKFEMANEAAKAIHEEKYPPIHFKESPTLIESIQSRKEKTSLYAYAFLIRSCDPQTKNYFVHLLSIITSVKILRDAGSKADMIIMIRTNSAFDEECLLEEHTKMLKERDIHIKYLTTTSNEHSFVRLLDKFSILQFVEYKRIMYMDSNIMPFCNLDYLFELSEDPHTILRPNIIVADDKTPAYGGLFILSPLEGGYISLCNILARKFFSREHGLDAVTGWGHMIMYPDEWTTLEGVTGTKWDFDGAYGEEGILYHWTKYLRKDVSIINGEKIESWTKKKSGEKTHPTPEIVYDDFYMFSSNGTLGNGCSPYRGGGFGTRSTAPFSDFKAFEKGSEPWAIKDPQILEKKEDANNAIDLWHFILRQDLIL